MQRAMENVQNQINDINNKLDLMLEYMAEQRQRSQVIGDLVQDVSIVGRDAFKYAVDELDKQALEIDPEQVKMLFIRLVKNVENFNNLLGMLNSLSDLAKDAAPIINEVIIDVTYKLAELENKGVFKSLMAIGNNLSSPQVLTGFENISYALATVKPDDKIDNKSLWKIFRELRSKEVRQSLSYMLRIVKATQQTKEVEQQ
ncbi:MAG: hypothetical protein CVU11_05415 [Bacteroidetes bacterium HGW-Bacteroidetes-6]|jgi:uncharacterized protein YjgD (DUF1641 family)|nr:MAG: hypothetical protein CVU11_05415 [Bacteroidetes bacterium HGW-Bacteroidetes-6]